ncbi:hypothetical protein G6F32_016521 [Rhizopus arrhizus]|nr:hypothetical protein G6F32_016521 [Rhizopus arrhizus]
MAGARPRTAKSEAVRTRRVCWRWIRRAPARYWVCNRAGAWNGLSPKPWAGTGPIMKTSTRALCARRKSMPTAPCEPDVRRPRQATLIVEKEHES